MTVYDFETLVDRSTQGSAKWMFMKEANPNVPAGIAPLSVADLDIPIAPEIVEGLKSALDHVVPGYTLPTDSYMEAVIGWMSKCFSWNPEVESIVLSAGVVPALFTAVRAFSEPGDGVIIQPPVYYPFFQAIERSNRKLVRNPLVITNGRYEIDFDNLKQAAQDRRNKILLFCSPHNPVGRVWTRDELEKIADIVLENDLILVSDEIHADLVMPGHRHTVVPTLGPDIARRSVVCTAPSKSFNLAGMAASNIMIADEQLRARFKEAQEATMGYSLLTTLGYAACELAYRKGEAWLAGLIELVVHNHQVLKQNFAEHFPELTVFDLEGTYLQWVDFRPLGIAAEELERINVHEAYLFLDEGTIFGEQEGAGFERFNLGTPTHVIEAALARLNKAYLPRRKV